MRAAKLSPVDDGATHGPNPLAKPLNESKKGRRRSFDWLRTPSSKQDDGPPEAGVGGGGKFQPDAGHVCCRRHVSSILHGVGVVLGGFLGGDARGFRGAYGWVRRLASDAWFYLAMISLFC